MISVGNKKKEQTNIACHQNYRSLYFEMNENCVICLVIKLSSGIILCTN